MTTRWLTATISTQIFVEQRRVAADGGEIHLRAKFNLVDLAGDALTTYARMTECDFVCERVSACMEESECVCWAPRLLMCLSDSVSLPQPLPYTCTCKDWVI